MCGEGVSEGVAADSFGEFSRQSGLPHSALL
jgi:hypothetical protein